VVNHVPKLSRTAAEQILADYASVALVSKARAEVRGGPGVGPGVGPGAGPAKNKNRDFCDNAKLK